jgi:DNA-binding NtrC family response regulator
MAKILIVDHDQDFLDATAERLRGEGHEIDVCVEAAKVAPMVAMGGYAMLLMDVNMPSLNAEDLLAVLRNIKSTSHTRVILWSLDKEVETQALAKKYEAEYINKDADRAAFASLVRHSFASKPPGMPT